MPARPDACMGVEPPSCHAGLRHAGALALGLGWVQGGGQWCSVFSGVGVLGGGVGGGERGVLSFAAKLVWLERG
jgi:hypothetical protein